MLQQGLVLLLCIAAVALCFRPMARTITRVAQRRQGILAASAQSSAALPSWRPLPRIAAVRGSDEEEGEGEGDDEEDAVPTPNPVIEDDSGVVSPFKEGISFPTSLNGSDVRVGIIMARWNADIIGGLYKGVNESLIACGVKPSNIFSTYVPGAYELPVTARLLAMSKRVDVIVCLGCLIKGDTMHFEYIASATSQGIMQVSLETLVPCIFGVLTVLDKQQAIVRSTGEKNEGLSWGSSAVEMGLNRMSALGVGVKPSTDKSASAFVAFNGTAGAVPGSSKNETGKTGKKFGF